MNIQLDDIPGLKRNVARAKRIEEAWRDLAFLPVLEEICGLPVVQLTLRRLGILLFSGSPFLSGAPATAEDVSKFLWVVSPSYNTRNLGRGDHIARTRVLPYRAACRQIDRYIDRALLDRPPASSRGKIINASFSAVMIDRIAQEYGWSESQILDTPVARLYQYLRIIRLRKDPEAAQISRVSDRIRARIVNRYLAQVKASAAEISPVSI